MSGKTNGATLIQMVANSKGWTFEELAQRWEISPRQMSRIAAAGKQRDVDAANGLPIRKKT